MASDRERCEMASDRERCEMASDRERCEIASDRERCEIASDRERGEIASDRERCEIASDRERCEIASDRERCEIKSVRANGIEIAYLEQGTGPLVVLLHGFPDTAHTWDPTLTALAAAGFHAVAPFMRSYFPTTIPEDGAYDSDTIGRDALALIDALGGPAILVGHDWGASAAYSAAGLGPDRLRLLVTLAIPHPRVLRPTPKLMWQLRHFLELRWKSTPAKMRASDFAYVDELWRRWSPAWKDLPASETAEAKACFAHPGVLEAACGYYRALSPILPPGQKAKIEVPAIAFAGEDDGLMPWRIYEKARHCFTKSYEVIQVPGGHFMHREHPEVFIPELVRALKSHAAL